MTAIWAAIQKTLITWVISNTELAIILGFAVFFLSIYVSIRVTSAFYKAKEQEQNQVCRIEVLESELENLQQTVSAIFRVMKTCPKIPRKTVDWLEDTDRQGPPPEGIQL